MRLTALSGLGTKGPACFLLEIAGRRLMLDLGKGPDGDTLPDLTGVGPVDAILFSHGHADHTGGLPLAVRLGDPPLFAPEPAIALSRDPAMKTARPLAAFAQFGLPFDCGPAGHAPGACWMRIGGDGGMVYTGDVSAESTLYRGTLPPPARVMVFDASYGAADEPLADQVADLLTLAERPLLLPAPAGGRGLEMALAFRAAGHRVSICAAHRAVAGAMADRPDWLVPGGAGALGRLLAEAGTLTPDGPVSGVMVAAGPNAERDTAAALARRMIAEGSGRVVFTGHLARGTPAPGWVAAGSALFRRWNVHPTLSGLRDLFGAVRPAQAMPAFCAPEASAGLAAALGRPLVTTPEVVW
ncbi:MBL fold metallo-hydrolase [Celeribacter indicus]|uniref:Beta-lactamase domain protein n=1 Tax=Celeribacter indicus TaxID=1208324 RepID=A0A0B5DXF3_9RHOB|nr:MBL fold metallo-hydrolase [Celeribacter indicus]AJE45775.1 beta-lactamase domain protein [Celeribacter indicus]SDW60311.1 Metallo-beta-lactamase superfamily protein [Celeribacter indicus]